MEKKYNLIPALVIAVLLSITFINAMEIDNIKSYNQNTKTLTVKNSILGLIPTSTVAEVKLETPQVFVVPAGYQQVAEITIKSNEDYDNILKSMEFVNVRTNTVENRSFDLKYKTIVNVSVPDYVQDCKAYLKNGTGVYCNPIPSGSHLEEKEGWAPLSEINLKEGEEITVGIFTNVKPIDHIDWIPEMFGVKVPEWAQWIESLNSGLVEYWSFDQGSGNIVIGNLSRFNLTSNSSTWIAGKNNNAMNFTKSSSQFARTTTNITQIFNTNITVNGWVRVQSLATEVNTEAIYKVGADVNAGDATVCNVWINVDAAPNSWIAVCPNNLNTGTAVTGDVGTFVMITAVYNRALNNWSVYRNGVLDSHTTTAAGGLTHGEFWIAKSSQGAFINAAFDEIGLWNRTLNTTEITYLYGGGNGTFYGPTGTTGITPNSPVDNFNSSNRTVVFNVTPSTSGTVVNVSLRIDNITNQTNTSGANNVPYLFYIDLIAEGNHNWTAVLETDTGQTISSVRTFRVDTTAPVLNITNPLNTTYITNYTNTSTQIVALNRTLNETNPSVCWYQLSNNTNVTLSCSSNTTLTVVYGQERFRVWANDTAGNYGFAQSYATFDPTIFQNNISYSNTTTEGSLEFFDIDFNISAIQGLTVSQIKLVYNGTLYNGSVISSSGNNIMARANVTIPNLVSQTNLTFYWAIRMSDGLYRNSSVFNQTVFNIAADDCTTFTNKLFTFTQVDEANGTNLTLLTNNTMEVFVSLLDSQRQQAVLNFSKSYSGVNPARVCLSISLPSGTMLPSDVIVKYYGTGYATEYYNIFNFTLSNTTANQNITLYDLNSDDNTPFKIIVTGDNFLPVPGALVFIDRLYVSENGTFKTVEIPITDSTGQTVGNFVRNSIVYNLRAVLNGTVIVSLDNVLAFCTDVQVGNCVIQMDTEGSAGSFSYFNDGITFSAPEFSSNTSLVTFNFVSTDGTPKTVGMLVTKNNVLLNRTVCSNSVTAASGTLSCNVSGGLSETMLSVNITSNGNLTAMRQIRVDEGSGYGNIGYVIWFVLTLFLILLFGESKTGILSSMAISYVGAVTLGITQGDIVGLGSAGIWVIVISAVGMWKLHQNRIQ